MEINRKPVVNATEPLKVEIEPIDIKGAVRRAPTGCAAARAIFRTVNCVKASVHLDRTFIEEENRVIRYRTPISLRNEIIAIDRGGQFMPGTHELKVLSKSAVARLNGKRQGGSTKDFDASRPGPLAERRKRRRFARKNHIIEGVRHRGANK